MDYKLVQRLDWRGVSSFTIDAYMPKVSPDSGYRVVASWPLTDAEAELPLDAVVQLWRDCELRAQNLKGEPAAEPVFVDPSDA